MMEDRKTFFFFFAQEFFYAIQDEVKPGGHGIFRAQRRLSGTGPHGRPFPEAGFYSI
jgi:hypothetical protein